MASNVVTVAVNWHLDNQKDIHEAIKIVNSSSLPAEHPDDNDDDIGDTVSVESCVHLRAPEGDKEPKCTLNFHCSPSSKQAITQLVVVSEARNLEVFTEHGEYQKTVPTEFIDKIDDDFIVYKGTVDFKQPVAACVIKFASVRKVKEFWLYGVRVKTVDVEDILSASNTGGRGFDVEKVLKRVRESDQQLSGKAESFVKLLSTCAVNKRNDITDVQNSMNYSEIMGLYSALLKQNKTDGTMQSFDAVGGTDKQKGELLTKYLAHLQGGAAAVSAAVPVASLPPSHPAASMQASAAAPDAGGSGEGKCDREKSLDGATCLSEAEALSLESLKTTMMQEFDSILKKRLKEMEDRIVRTVVQRLAEKENEDFEL